MHQQKVKPFGRILKIQDDLISLLRMYPAKTDQQIPKIGGDPNLPGSLCFEVIDYRQKTITSYFLVYVYEMKSKPIN